MRYHEREPEPLLPAVTPAPEPAPPHPARPLSQWQHALGNQHLQDLVRARGSQNSSVTGQSSDPLEQEANRTAEALTQPNPAIAPLPKATTRLAPPRRTRVLPHSPLPRPPRSPRV
ncbi:MAG: hypothetical protein M5U12_31590 [Verrucomicrobia bacterium]|nr:hypothetical protein [Verrucomicrobiota bacterium]